MSDIFDDSKDADVFWTLVASRRIRRETALEEWSRFGS
jgi:hypothetical protein